MKFARGFAVVSLLSASLPLAVACGSAGDSGLFSPSGGGLETGSAGAGTDSAGASGSGSNAKAGAAGSELSTAGSDSNGSAGVAGKGNQGGSSGAPSGGMSAGGAPAAGSGGAAAGSAGAGAGAGGATGGAAGTAGTGGLSTGGGMGGSAGGGDVPVCPTAAPVPQALCDVITPDSCFYAGSACSCLPVSPGSKTRRWACYGTPDICPDTKPSTGTSCKMNLGAECPYPGADFCACLGGGNEAHWSCQLGQPLCAQAKPNDGASCYPTVKTCSYGADACFCNGYKWGCEGG